MTCSARIYDSTGFGRMRDCNNADKYTDNGKRYCSIHYPPNAAKRRAKRTADYQLQLAALRRNRDVPRVIADSLAEALANCQRVLDDKGGTDAADWTAAELEARQNIQAYANWSKS